MVDQMTSMPPQGTPIPGDPASAPAGSDRKRILIIAVAIVAFVVVAALVAVAVMYFVDSSADDEASEAIQTSQSTSSSNTEAEDAPYVPGAPDPVKLTGVFTFRNIFEPLAVPPEVEEEVETTTGTDGTTTTVTSDTLYLRSITAFADGHLEADFLYGDVNYMLAVGERIPNTPWEVLAIGPDSVVMLYGDTQVSFVSGQTVTK